MVSYSFFLVVSSFLNLRLLSSDNFFEMALLSSARLKKLWFLRAARIQRSATSTADSTLALSLGRPGRAGITVVL